MASATENDNFKKALFPDWPLDDVVDWIKANMEPEDVFTETALESWAEQNEYARVE